MATERWSNHATASVVVLRPMLAFAAAQGVDVEAILRDLGVPSSALDDIDRRIPESDRCRAWLAAARGSRDDAFGLHVATHASIGSYDVLDYAISLSSALHEALERILRFYRILGDAWQMRLAVEGDIARLRRVRPTPPSEAESFVALLVLRARELTGHDLAPLEVRFAHEAPRDTTAQAALFRCPVRFGCSACELVLPAEDLTLLLKTPNPGLARILDRYMTEILARLPEDDTFLAHVRRLVGTNLHRGRPTLGALAADLHASPRTVQRMLAEHGTSHLEVVDSIRREIAEPLVREGRMSITEIAFLLGFKDVGSFRHVYKRWTGRPPSRRPPDELTRPLS
jgi:AraC-like DNA-binding protein